jgi:cobalt-zinc-cadmium efflux system outer membrane protein
MRRFLVVLAVSITPHVFASGPPTAELPPLTLAQARERALAHNPEIAALALAVEGRAGAVEQARVWPNPELGWEQENLRTTPGVDDPIETTTTLAQPLELWGTRAARVRAAEATGKAARSELEQRQRDIVAETERAFVQVLAAQERVTLAIEAGRTAQQLAETVAAMVDAGEVSGIEQTRSQADASLARIELAAAERELVIARNALARQWGAPAADFAVADGALADLPVLPDAAAPAVALGALPDLARLDAERDALDARQIELRRQIWPMPTVSAGYRRYGNWGHGWVAGVSLPLPLWDRNRGSLIEAGAAVRRATLERASEEIRLRAALDEALALLRSTRDEAQALRTEVLPQVQSTFAAIEEGYRRGKFRLLDLLDARRTLTETHARHVDALLRTRLAAIDVTRLLPASPAATSGVTP